MSAGTERNTEATGEGRALVLRTSPAIPAAAVLLLHGGREEGPEPPPLVNLPALRMRPFAAAVVRATRGRDVLVAEVRYRHRGWNGSRCDAARDAEAALVRLRELAGDVPVVLVGHSMGGRAALRAAGAPLVHGVVALAPGAHRANRWTTSRAGASTCCTTRRTGSPRPPGPGSSSAGPGSRAPTPPPSRCSPAAMRCSAARAPGTDVPQRSSPAWSHGTEPAPGALSSVTPTAIRLRPVPSVATVQSSMPSTGCSSRARASGCGQPAARYPTAEHFRRGDGGPSAPDPVPRHRPRPDPGRRRTAGGERSRHRGPARDPPPVAGTASSPWPMGAGHVSDRCRTGPETPFRPTWGGTSAKPVSRPVPAYLTCTCWGKMADVTGTSVREGVVLALLSLPVRRIRALQGTRGWRRACNAPSPS